MSVKAMTWAFGQDIPDAGAKLVLLVLADRADHNTWTCFPRVSTIARDASQSERSVQRKLGWLEQNGYLHRYTTVDKGARQGANTYELVFDRPADEPAMGDNLSPVDGRGDSETPLKGEQPENALPAAMGDKLAPGDGVVTGEGDTAVTPNTNPHIEPSSPLTPQARGEAQGLPKAEQVSREEQPSEEWDRFLKFWRNYPDHAVMDRASAWAVWLSLAPEARTWAAAAVVTYAQKIAASKRKPAECERWLSLRSFEDFPEHRPEPPPHFVELNSDSWRARAVISRIMGWPMPVAVSHEGCGVGVMVRHALPPDALALARFALPPPAPTGEELDQGPVDFGGWVIAEEGTQQLGAWRSRLHEWIGQRPEADRIYTGGISPKNVNGREEKVRNRRIGVLVPGEWPPRKKQSGDVDA